MKSFLIAVLIAGSLTSHAFAQGAPTLLTKESIARSVGLPSSTPWEDLERAFDRKILAEGCVQLDIESWKCTEEYIWAPYADERRLTQINYQVLGMSAAQAENHLSQQLKLSIPELRNLRAFQKRRDQAKRHVSLARESFRQARDRESQ